jgi:hypothetical protein
MVSLLSTQRMLYGFPNQNDQHISDIVIAFATVNTVAIPLGGLS